MSHIEGKKSEKLAKFLVFLDRLGPFSQNWSTKGPKNGFTVFLGWTVIKTQSSIILIKILLFESQSISKH